jgi:hypothetical protein
MQEVKVAAGTKPDTARQRAGATRTRKRVRIFAASLALGLTTLVGASTLGATAAYADENCVHGNGWYWGDPFDIVTYHLTGQNTYYYGSSLHHTHTYYENWANILGGNSWQGYVTMACPLH